MHGGRICDTRIDGGEPVNKTSKGSGECQKQPKASGNTVYPERDLNPHVQWTSDFESDASANSAIRA